MHGFEKFARVSLEFMGVPVVVDSDGFIGPIVSVGHGTIRLELLLSNPNTIALVPYMEQGVRVCKKRVEEDGSYQLRVEVKKADRSSVYHTERTQNHLNILHLEREGENVRLRVWEISLISQYGNFFLITQERDSVLVFTADDKIVYSEEYMMKDHPFWTSFRELAQTVIREKGIVLSVNGQMAKIPVAENLPQNTGICIHFRLAHGVGMILTPDNGMVAVHYSAIRSRNRLAFLERGSLVRYNGVSKKLDTWQHKSQLQMQAFGVRPV